MLVLSRRVGEEICLPELGVKITVLKNRGGRASLGVEAPDEVKILRGELPQKSGCFNDSSVELNDDMTPALQPAMAG